MDAAVASAVGEYRYGIYAFAFALVVALVATPLTSRLAVRLGAVDMPGARRVHTTPTPRLGGFAILVAMLVGALLAWDLHGVVPHRGRDLIAADQMVVTVLAALLVTVIGAWDDIRGMLWWKKLSGQVASALAVVVGPLATDSTIGITQLTLVVRRIDPPFLPPVTIPDVLGICLAVLWIVALMNMVNFIDGVDGLAAGTCAISAATFAAIAVSYNRIDIAILAAALCGAAVGFLRYNFTRDRARIFMGDSGSMLLGFMLGVIAIQGVLKTAAAVSLIIPLALLAVPILDTLFVVAKRMKYNIPLSSADRWHLHHRLLNVGYTPRKVAGMFWLWTTSMSAVALALRFVPYKTGKQWHPEWLMVLSGFVLVAICMSVYIVIALEIVKLRRVRERNAARAAELRRRDELRTPAHDP